MNDSAPSFDWYGLLRLIGLWLVVVFLALRALDFLFPRMRRDDGDAPALRAAPPTARPRLRLRAGPTQRVAQRSSSAPSVGQAYWQTNRRMIVALLAIWVGASLVPAVFSPWLNSIQIFNGFPLGYYMGSQGSLIVFLGLITAYAWRTARLDSLFRSAPWLPDGAREGRAATRRIGAIYALFTLGFIMFALLMGALEERIGLPANMIGWALLIVTIGLYAVIGVTNRAHTLDDYFVAGRRIPPFFNGMAI